MTRSARQSAVAILRRLRDCWKPLVLGAGTAAGLALLFACDPATTSIYPPCPFRTLTGLRCPGCGTLRALHQLLHGNVMAALRLNPLMVLSLPLLAYCFVGDFVHEVSGYRLPTLRIGPGPVWVLLVVILTFWIVRNIPCSPFVLLAA